MIKCTRCNGNKNILGMGGMKTKCSECSGVGFKTEVKPTITATNVTPITKAKNKKAKINQVEAAQT